MSGKDLAEDLIKGLGGGSAVVRLGKEAKGSRGSSIRVRASGEEFVGHGAEIESVLND